jgi:hypothetical protein
MDSTPLREAYRALLDAAAAVASAATVASGAHTTYDNRRALDTWTIDRVISLAGGNAGLRERVRGHGEVLCALGGPALSDAELDTGLPTLLLSHDTVLVDRPLPLRDLIMGLAEAELPGHTRQLLDLLGPAAAS